MKKEYLYYGCYYHYRYALESCLSIFSMKIRKAQDTERDFSLSLELMHVGEGNLFMKFLYCGQREDLNLQINFSADSAAAS